MAKNIRASCWPLHSYLWKKCFMSVSWMYTIHNPRAVFKRYVPTASPAHEREHLPVWHLQYVFYVFAWFPGPVYSFQEYSSPVHEKHVSINTAITNVRNGTLQLLCNRCNRTRAANAIVLQKQINLLSITIQNSGGTAFDTYLWNLCICF